jgi:hypothetical protein
MDVLGQLILGGCLVIGGATFCLFAGRRRHARH